MKKPTHLRCFMALMLLLVTGGCATLPDNVGREASTAYVDTHDTRIGRNVQAAMAEHPGESGYLLLERPDSPWPVCCSPSGPNGASIRSIT